jgi:CubicO group peptidase (beta-lactamase class C family)
MTTLLPDADTPIEVPAGWSSAPSASVLTLVGPECDLCLSFLSVPKDAAAVDLAAAAWRAVDASFDLPVFNEAEGAPAGGWGETFQIAYAAPHAESRSALAIVRMLGERAYVTLISGSKAALSRRMAHVGELIDAWRPAGIAEADLNDRAARTWGAAETAALERFMRAGMEALEIPGLAVAIVQDGAVALAEGFGVTSLAEPAPVGAGTRFMIGSMTKSLTTMMMARLVAAGRFAWTTPVTHVLPGFALADSDVTARLQMRHTVGAGTGMPRRDTELLIRTRGVTAADRVAEMAEMEPTTGFGETFQYSNYLVAAGGYAAARALRPEGTLEDAYASAMREFVFAPLDVRRTTVPPANGAFEDEAAPHGRTIGGHAVAIDGELERFADAVAPAGAAWSTVTDVARYLQLELAGDAALAARREPQSKIDGKSAYGLGLFLTTEQGIALIGHGGNTIGFSSDMFFLPDKGVGVVVLSNVAAANAFLAAVKQRIFELLFGAQETAEQMVASTAKTIAQFAATRTERIRTDPEGIAMLKDWVGDYRCKELGPARVAATADGYRVDFESWGSELGVETQADGQPLIVLTTPPWSGNLRLRPGANGDELILDAAQTVYTFVRVRA